MKVWQNTQFMTATLFCFTFTAQRGEYNVIVRDSEPIRFLESPRSLSVYMLNLNIVALVLIALFGKTPEVEHSDQLAKHRQPNRKSYRVPMCTTEKLLYNYLFYHFFLHLLSIIYYLYLFNNQTTSPSFLRADSQRGAAELTIARRKRGQVV